MTSSGKLSKEVLKNIVVKITHGILLRTLNLLECLFEQAHIKGMQKLSKQHLTYFFWF